MRVAAAALLLLALTFTACAPSSQNLLPQAYIAPASVNLRAELNRRNSTVIVLKHGDKVGILDMRRRFVRVRTAKGQEGWLDSLELLSPEAMQRIQRERAEARTLPSEGTATAYEKLNIHLDPNRKSPAFTQIPENGAVQVLARKLTPKLAPPPRSIITFEKPAPPRRHSRRAHAKSSSRQPPRPPAPKPPANWQQTWGLDTETEAPDEAEKEPQKPVVLEAWFLVRTKAGETGWALARNLMMAIPDEVAQYAAGRHITSYFDLGAVIDERDGVKHNWLWTTASAEQTADFDSWRVFLWNRRRHRYETSYRQHDVIGYFPVHVDAPDPARSGRTFELIMKADDGKLSKRTYLFDGTRVHLISTSAYQPEQSAAQQIRQKTPVRPGWFKREWGALKKSLGRS